MKWNFVSFTMSKILGACVIFIQAPTKYFNLSANGASGILYDKNNLFFNGWTFCYSHWIGFFSGFKSMLKKVCFGVVIPTISLLLTPCLSVVGMTLLLLLLVIIMEIFDPVFVRKNFCPSHFLSACEGLNEKGFLCSIKISLVCFLDLMLSAICFLNFFKNRYSSCFCRSEAFSFIIDFISYWEFITLLNTFNILWYVIALLCYCFVTEAIQSVQRNGASHL